MTLDAASLGLVSSKKGRKGALKQRVRFGNAMKNEQFGLCLMLKNGEGRSGRQDDKSLEFSTWVSAAHQRLTSHLRHTHTVLHLG